ncbi:Rz1-like lysis system protein LysC [Dickeya lacustris]|uniref:Rz1-like lysis system protein LysC n=1 Tax=Dickeya lacustris TaxID=2259638 RepID=A0ABY8G9H4_9GAMM|nr:Rz1-like lysis system protein LysC [Dickeya lacustris]WFN56629.1 Rz1-like lysis system protein LysC [Dickeya lacustris]
MTHLSAGPILLCLTTLFGCTSAPPSPAPTLIVNGCPRITPCRFPASNLQTNGDLGNQLDETEAALAICAEQVDIIIACQRRISTDAPGTPIMTGPSLPSDSTTPSQGKSPL